MDNNKDESERCIVIAIRLIAEGKRDRALKYLLKSEKLYPSDRAKELMEKLNSSSNSNKTDGSSSHSSDKKNSTCSPSTRRRKTKVSDKEDENCDLKSEYSQEQTEAVQSIKRCKDYYEILGVSKDATDSDLKKQYRKLALQFHPDKNQAPGASEAFKAIGNAFAVLSDPTKRKQYDTYGSDYLQTPGRAEQNGHYDYSRGFEGDISAEEIFNMFFGGGLSGSYGGGNVFVRRGNQWQRYRQPADTRQDSSHSVILQMVPLFVLVSLSLLSSFLVSDPPYSLTRTTKYYHEQKTRNLDIPYYVKENFLNEYKGKILRIESQVEEDYISNIRSSCFRERNYKESMIWRAKNFRDVSLESKARSLRTPSCDALNDLYKKY